MHPFFLSEVSNATVLACSAFLDPECASTFEPVAGVNFFETTGASYDGSLNAAAFFLLREDEVCPDLLITFARRSSCQADRLLRIGRPCSFVAYAA